MERHEFSREEVEATKKAIVKDSEYLKSIGVDVVLVAKMRDENRVRVGVRNADSVRPILRERYGEIVHVFEARIIPF